MLQFLSFYFTSSRAGGFGGQDIWISERPSTDAPWGPPFNAGPNINTALADRTPELSRDGHTLFFASDRPGGFGALDLFVARRDHVHNNFDWQPATNLGPAVNSEISDTGPSFIEDGELGSPELYFARGATATTTDIFVSTQQADRTFGPALAVAELNTPAGDAGPDIRHDGLEIFIHSTRPGSAGVDLWVSTRSSVLDPWSPPVNVGSPINSSFGDRDGTFAGPQMLFFGSDRPGGFGGEDIYFATRDKERGRTR